MDQGLGRGRAAGNEDVHGHDVFGAVQNGVVAAKDPSGNGAAPHGDHDLGSGDRRIGPLAGELHVPRDRAGDQDAVGEPGRGGGADAEALEIVLRRGRHIHLDLAGIAGARIELAELEGTAEQRAQALRIGIDHRVFGVLFRGKEFPSFAPMSLQERGLVPRCNGQTESIGQRAWRTSRETPSAPDAEFPAYEEFGGIQFQRFRGAGGNAGAAAGALSGIEPGDFDPAGLGVGEKVPERLRRRRGGQVFFDDREHIMVSPL